MQFEDKSELMPLIGTSLGQFRLVEQLGSGGMATVYKAYQPTLDRYVAIKVLTADVARDPIFEERFKREAQSIAKLAHPNILQIYDFGVQDAITYYTVMEYIDGGTLKDRLRKQALPVPEAVDFVMQAAVALEYAHRNGIVHRDVKPANMLLRKDGSLLLSDFGIAKILEGTSDLTSTGIIIGTPLYISPEQATGQSVDSRSDIYSLGIVLFHCLTGRLPFNGDSPLTIIMRHLNEPLPVEFLRSMRIPAPLEQVVLKMTAKSPTDRYLSGNSVIEALNEAIAASDLTLPRLRSGEQPQEKTAPSLSPAFQQNPSPELFTNAQVQQESSERLDVNVNSSQPQGVSPSTMLFSDALLSHVNLRDFFIIYSRADRLWAKWIAWELENAGYSAILPPWSFRPDSDFEMEMQKAAAKAKCTIVILSPDYLNILNTQSASASIFSREGINGQNTLLPIRVRESGSEFSKLLELINPIDLAGEDESTARTILLASVRDEGIKLTTPPVFPGRDFHDAFDTEPGFPNKQPTSVKVSDRSINESSIPQAYFLQGINVFFSYSHKDKKLRSELEKYLRYLNEAHIILLLVSQDFMASDYCYDIEMQKALERHETGEAQVIPIILRPAIWEDTPIGKLQALPTGARPIFMWSNKEQAFMDVARGIQKAIDKLKGS